MKLFIHYSFEGFSNTYLFGPEDGGDAVLVDPGVMDVELLNLIENNTYYIRTILITHAHTSHVGGIRTLKKIYNAELYGRTTEVSGFSCNKIKDGEEFSAADFKVVPIELPGHSHDSIVFSMKDLLFTGDALEAGRVSSTPNAYARSILLSAVQEKISIYPDSTIVLPGHGPPSVMGAEKKYNPSFYEPLSRSATVQT